MVIKVTIVKLTMKKIVAISSILGYYFFTASNAFAQTIKIIQPTGSTGKPIGYGSISEFINAGLRLAFIIALIAVLVMLVWGAVEWIFSGGNKEAYGKARDRIIHALVGLAILAIAFAIVTLAGQFVGINLLGEFIIPSPANTTPAIPGQ